MKRYYKLKNIFIDKIGEIYNNFKIKKAIIEILPNYEFVKYNIDGYSESYKMQMRNLIKMVLINIK